MADPTRINGAKYRDAPPHVVARVIARREIAPDGCWMWPGSTLKGYGNTVYKVGGRQFNVYIHRLVYTHIVGDPGDTTQLDHCCHNPETCTVRPSDCPHRRCFNPKHLEPVTNLENSMRGRTLIAINTAKTECDAGHAFDEANTCWFRGTQRRCRECTRLREAARRAVKSDEINAGRRAASLAAKLAAPRYCCVCGVNISLRNARATYCVTCSPAWRPDTAAQHAAMERGS